MDQNLAQHGADEETPVVSFLEDDGSQGPWFMVEGEDFGKAVFSDSEYSVDIELLRATQRLDRLCSQCSKPNILKQIDALDEDISQICEEFENFLSLSQEGGCSENEVSVILVNRSRLFDTL